MTHKMIAGMVALIATLTLAAPAFAEPCGGSTGREDKGDMAPADANKAPKPGTNAGATESQHTAPAPAPTPVQKK